MVGKITPNDAVIKNEFSTAVQAYCEGTYSSVDEAMEAFKDGVAGSITDGSVVVE